MVDLHRVFGGTGHFGEWSLILVLSGGDYYSVLNARRVVAMRRRIFGNGVASLLCPLPDPFACLCQSFLVFRISGPIYKLIRIPASPLSQKKLHHRREADRLQAGGFAIAIEAGDRNLVFPWLWKVDPTDRKFLIIV